MPWKVTTIIENNPDKNKKYSFEHGLSLLIEEDAGPDAAKNSRPGVRILMDTGDSGSFFDNAKKMGLSLDDLDAVLISHAHYDHAGGFLRFIKEKGAPKQLYVGKGFFKKSFTVNKEGRLRYIGIRFDRKMLEDLGVGIHELEEDSLDLFPGVSLHRNFRQIYDWEAPDDQFVFQEERQACFGGRCMDSMLYLPDRFPEETALTLDTPEGLVLIVGCSHPGIMNIIRTIEERTGRKICGLIGGSHLMEADPERVDKTIRALKDQDLKLLALCHCTGAANLPRMQEEFADCFVYNNTGNVIRID